MDSTIPSFPGGIIVTFAFSRAQNTQNLQYMPGIRMPACKPFSPLRATTVPSGNLSPVIFLVRMPTSFAPITNILGRTKIKTSTTMMIKYCYHFCLLLFDNDSTSTILYSFFTHKYTHSNHIRLTSERDRVMYGSNTIKRRCYHDHHNRQLH